LRLAVLAIGVDTCQQKILVGSDDIHMAAVQIHILKYGSPSGSMRVNLLDSTKAKTLATSDVAISSVSGSYFHGMVKFDLKYSLKKNTNYWIELSSTGGYSYSGSAYFGGVLGDSLAHNNNPGLDIRVLHYRNLNRGRA